MIASGLITASGSLNWKLKVYIIIFGYWLKYPWRYVWVIFVIEVCSMSNLNHCVESLLQVCKVSAVIKVHFWKGYVADKVLKHWLFFIYRFYFSSVVVLVFLVKLWPENMDQILRRTVLCVEYNITVQQELQFWLLLVTWICPWASGNALSKHLCRLMKMMLFPGRTLVWQVMVQELEVVLMVDEQ